MDTAGCYAIPRSAHGNDFDTVSERRTVNPLPLGWRNNPELSDFHELWQDFSPTHSPQGCRAFHAIILPHVHRVSVISKADNLFALCATRGFKFWRVLQFFKVVFIRAIIDVYFRLKIVAAFLARFPIARMPLNMMVTAQRIAVMVPITTVMSIREQHVVVCIIANPGAAAFCSGQVIGLAAQSATRLFLHIFSN
jgi:hypothetical protein